MKEGVADPERQDLFGAVVLHVVNAGLDGRSRFKNDGWISRVGLNVRF